MYEFDNTMAYLSLESAQKFFSMGARVTGIEIKTDDLYQVKKIGKEIRREWISILDQRLDGDEQKSIQCSQLEKIAMFIILVLIVLVAAFNIISTLHHGGNGKK